MIKKFISLFGKIEKQNIWYSLYFANILGFLIYGIVRSIKFFKLISSTLQGIS